MRKHTAMIGTIFLALAIVLTSCLSVDPCSGSSSPEACSLYRAQVAATDVALERDRKAEATRVAAQAENDRIRAEGEAALNKASAQSTTEALDRERKEADQRAAIAAGEADQRATITADEAHQRATITADKANISATATLTAIQDQSNKDRLNAAGLFIRDVAFYAGSLGLLFLAGYWAVNYIRRKSATVDTPAGTVLVLPAPNPFATRIYNPLLAESVVVDTSAPPQASREDTIRRKQVVDLALAAARANADVVNEGEVIEESGWAQTDQPRQADMPSLPALPLPGTFPRSQLVLPPSYSEIATSWKPTPDRMLMAYTPTGQPIYGPLKNLMSMIILGRPDFGKTTLERFIMIQCLQVGARAIVWDPHDNIADGLPGTEVCSTVKAVQQSCEQVLSILDHRIKNKLYNEQPILVIVDEFNLIAGGTDGIKEVSTVIRRIVTEGRKPGVYSIISAKGVPAAQFGGEWVVGAFTGHYIMNCRPSIARSANLETAVSRQVELLQPGEAILECGRIPPQMVLIPNTTREDVKTILLTSGNGSQAGSQQNKGNGSQDPLSGSQAEVPWKSLGSQAGSQEEDGLDPIKMQQIVDLLKRKATIKDVIQQVFGVTGSGRPYLDAYEELRRYLEEIARKAG